MAQKSDCKPVRTCIACRKKRNQTQFLRIGWIGSTTSIVGKYHTGRGCYICKTVECITKALEKDRLSRSLKKSIEFNEKEKLGESLFNRL